MRVTVIPIVTGAPRTVPESLEKKTGGIGNQRKNRDHADHSNDEIGLNTLITVMKDTPKLIKTQNTEN